MLTSDFDRDDAAVSVAKVAAEGKLETGPLWQRLRLSFAVRTQSKRVLACYCSLAGVAVCTWLGFHLRLNLASSGFLHLIVVVFAAVYGGFPEATVASIVSVVSLNYFFAAPIFNFRVSDPANWVALGAFELTALVISRLSHRAQVRSAEAVSQRHDSERLYRTSQRILLIERSQDPGPAIASLIRESFSLPGVVLFDAVSGEIHVSGASPQEAEQHTQTAYFMNSDEFDALTNSWFCVLRVGAQPIGGLALCDCRLTPLVATSLSSLSAIALERARSFEKEYRAEAVRHSEQLRTAVLDAMAHEIKTPLTIIRTASSGLLAAGGLSAIQSELLTLIDDQGKKLNDLASRLLGAAKLDSTDFTPVCQPLLLSSLVDATIESLGEEQRHRQFRVHRPADEASVLADRKLLQTALAQLIDNAMKYSVAGSPIDVGVVVTAAEVIVTVQNLGLPIAPGDHQRVFERFYRAAGTEQRPAGTGLGLSIVKRIVEAHCGRVWVKSDLDSGTAFSFALPRRAQ